MKQGLISKLGLLSINKYRVTLMSFLVLLLAGFLAYSNFLPRKGFPALEFPIVIIQTPYAVNDVNKVDMEISKPLELALNSLEGVNSIQTTTTGNFNLTIVNFETGIGSSEKADEIKALLEEGIGLPKNIIPKVSSVTTGSFDGENELVLGLISTKKASVEQLESKAQGIAESLSDLSQVSKASVIKQINNIYDPYTQTSKSAQTAFNRYGIKNDGEFVFTESMLIGVKNNDSYTITEISSAINSKISELRDSGDLGEYDVVTIYDQADDLSNQINSLELNALNALVAVIIVLLLFVNWRAAIITAIFVPTVMAGTFLVMLLAGVSLNVISLFALILVLGLLVDDAIVVIEAIVVAKKEGYKGKDAIIKALNAVGKADVVGSLTTLLVFIPMLFIVGILGDIVKDIPITVIITLSVSLVVALTIIPLFAYKFISDEKKGAKKNIINRIFELPINFILKLSELVSQFVNMYLSKWYLTTLIIALSIGLIVAGLFFGSISKVANFAAEKDSNGIQAIINFSPTTTLEDRENTAINFENKLIDKYGDIVQKITYPYVGLDTNTGQQIAYVFVELTPLAKRDITSIAVANELSTEFQNLENAQIQIEPITNGGPPSEEYASKIQLFAEDDVTLLNLGNEIKDFIGKLELPKDVTIEDSKIENVEILVKRNGRRYAQVSSKLSEDGDDATVAFIDSKVREEFNKEKLNSLGLPADALDTDKGFQEEFTKSVISAVVALGVSFIFMYFFLVVVFNSFGRALLIMTALPFTFFGLFGGLYLTNNPISFFVIIGVIALTGIVVNNSIMLLDFANQERENGVAIKESIVNAVRIRFRPLMTTSATTLVGLLPLAFSEPFWESLAFAIAFGLASSTVMVIFVFPAYYYVLENLRAWKSKQVLRFK